MSLIRQLDFLARLIAPHRPAPPTAAPAMESAAALETHARQLLRALGCAGLAARVRVRWNPRMRSTAGTAFARQTLITLNPRLREFGEKEVDRTLRHELAHLLAHFRAGR